MTHLVMQLQQLISTKVVPQEERFLLRLRGTSWSAKTMGRIIGPKDQPAFWKKRC